MTEAEQDQIIAEMVRDRRKLIRKVACLEAALSKADEQFGTAQISAARASRQSNPDLVEIPDYPDAATLREWLADLETARERLASLNRKLDGI